MRNVILVLNAGSSSLKFSFFVDHPQEPELCLHGQIEGLAGAPHFVAKDAAGAILGERRWADGTRLGHDGAAHHLVEFLQDYRDRYQLIAVGHRVVHGGQEFSRPTRVDGEMLKKLEKLIPLAPLHQPHNLAPIRALAERAPQLPQVACFDTAFHRRQPELAQLFALPPAITGRGVRRYGFHGLSYEYIASVLPQLAPEAAAGRVVVAHLGNGASLCAMRGGRSLASTMGFTAVDGLPMGTRCGTLDPGVILYLLDELKMDARAIERLIYKESGLLGVSGISSDMRELLASDAPGAALAVDLFVYRIGRELGSLAAALGGLDALVFTAGIGEHAAAIRERVCRDAAWLGLELDTAANEAGGARISTDASRVSAWVVPTNEELMIARHTRQALSSS
ncbi:acetate/propionate family kinase [Azotobacter salinestris]|uniref:acetate/propionate family kinase n=1 Tax=Azotobacter salinestris TaxID=69964 RepID=UPI0032DF7864